MDVTAYLAGLIAAASLGAMLFFSAVVTPTIFAVLPADAAGRFLRTIFPRYFIANGVMALTAAGLAAWQSSTIAAALILAACGVALLLTRAVMVPIINAARDRMTSGDGSAKATFDRWHRASVLVNLAEMAGLITAVVMLLPAARL